MVSVSSPRTPIVYCAARNTVRHAVCGVCTGVLDFDIRKNFSDHPMPVQRPPLAPRQKISPVEIYWKTVTYRTVALYLFMVFAVVLAILYLIFPESFSGA